MTDKFMALGFSLLILGQAYLVRRLVGTWLFPACLFGLFWFLLTFIPLVLLFAVPIAPLAVGYLFLVNLAFSFTALLFDWRPVFERNALKEDTESIYGSRFIRRAFYGLVGTSLALVVLNLLTQGISLYNLVFNLFASAQTYAQLRYNDELSSTLVERLSIITVYLGVTLGGLRFSAASRTGRRLILGLSFLPSVLITVTQSAMWHFLLSVVLFYSGILVYRISVGDLSLIEKGKAKWLALYGCVVLGLLLLTFLSRGLYDAADSGILIQALTGRLASYSSGHLYAFADWFNFALGGRSELTYPREFDSNGFYTFATLFRLLGSDRVLPIGVYEDYYTYGTLLNTNVFTMFRGLILDFGYFGALLFMSALGICFHGAFYALLNLRRPVLPVVCFILMMCVFYSSFVVSLLGSNIIYYLTFGCLWGLLTVNRLMTSPYKLLPQPGAASGRGLLV